MFTTVCDLVHLFKMSSARETARMYFMLSWWMFWSSKLSLLRRAFYVLRPPLNTIQRTCDVCKRATLTPLCHPFSSLLCIIVLILSALFDFNWILSLEHSTQEQFWHIITLLYYINVVTLLLLHDTVCGNKIQYDSGFKLPSWQLLCHSRILLKQNNRHLFFHHIIELKWETPTQREMQQSWEC